MSPAVVPAPQGPGDADLPVCLALLQEVGEVAFRPGADASGASAPVVSGCCHCDGAEPEKSCLER